MAAAKAKLYVLSLMTFVMLACASPNTNAQADFSPFERIFFLRVIDDHYVNGSAGDIYSWRPGDDAPVQETTGGWNHGPILSPNGRYLVYSALPPVIAAARERGEDDVYSTYFCCGPYPTELFLIDLTTERDDPTHISRLTEPLTLTELTDDLSVYHYNSDPVWSPDGTRFAWVEYFQGSRILMYDTRSREVHTISSPVNTGYGDGSDWGIPRLEGWGDGIAHTFGRFDIHSRGADEVRDSFGMALEIFSEAGDKSTHVITYLTSPTDEYDYWLTWVQYGGEWHLLIYYTKTGFVLFDPGGITFKVLQDLPAFESVLGGGWQGVIIIPDPAPLNPRLGGQMVEWQINGVPLTHQPPATLRFNTFDPFGVPLFVESETGVLVYWDAENGIITPVLAETGENWRISSADWVPGVWTVRGETTPIEQTCCALSTPEPDN